MGRIFKLVTIFLFFVSTMVAQTKAQTPNIRMNNAIDTLSYNPDQQIAIAVLSNIGTGNAAEKG